MSMTGQQLKMYQKDLKFNRKKEGDKLTVFDNLGCVS